MVFLPGGLCVRRRAKGIYDALIAERGTKLASPHMINDWMSVYAMAVNEENAAGCRVVTKPTNGAAGVLLALLRYYLDHVPGATKQNRRLSFNSRRNWGTCKIQCLNQWCRGGMSGRSRKR